MGFKIVDTTGEIEQGSIYLPVFGAVAIPGPVRGQVAALREELNQVYGDRFRVELDESKPAGNTAAKSKRSSRR